MRSTTLIVCVILALGAMCTRAQVGHFTSATSGATDTLAFNLSGGAFKSYGCKAIDPTYWVSGNGAVITVTFAKPETNPSFRVWGMNTDDAASVSVNGSAYQLSPQTASYTPKVVCGTSPGPNGVLFASGLLVGANTPSEANYSYQDIQLMASDVTTITITALKGAGWGFAGTSVYRTPASPMNASKTPAVPADETTEQGKQ